MKRLKPSTALVAFAKVEMASMDQSAPLHLCTKCGRPMPGQPSDAPY